MAGIDPSRLVQGTHSFWAGLLEAVNRPSGSDLGGGADGRWRSWLLREQARPDNPWSAPSPPSMSSVSPSGSWLSTFLESLPFLAVPWGRTEAYVASVGRREPDSSHPQQYEAGRGFVSAALREVPPNRSGLECPGGLVPDQFDPSLSSQEAYAACGPAAAVAFARASQLNPSVREALDLAKTVGWTATGGMNGVINQKRLLERMGVSARLETSGDWKKIAEEVSAGKPVTISTPGHYFVADAYDSQTGRFHLGASGTAYRNGREWMNGQEMESLGGRVNGTLVLEGKRSWTA